jgi:hypothetical protein
MNGVHISNYEMIWTRPHNLAITLEELVRILMLPPTRQDYGSPEPRYSGEKRSRIYCKRMKWREPVEDDGRAQEEKVQ